MKKLFALFLAAMLMTGSAAAAPVTSYREVQNALLAAAYKVKPFEAALTGEIFSIVPSYTFKNTYYLFVIVDPDDVSMWGPEDDDFFVTIINSEKDPFPFSQGDTVTVEGKISSIYSSPVCPYIKAEKINGSDNF